MAEAQNFIKHSNFPRSSPPLFSSLPRSPAYPSKSAAQMRRRSPICANTQATFSHQPFSSLDFEADEVILQPLPLIAVLCRLVPIKTSAVCEFHNAVFPPRRRPANGA